MRYASGMRIRQLILSLAAVGCGTTQPTPDAQPQYTTDGIAADLLAACPDARRELATNGACTELGCSSGFSLSTQPRAAWPHGAYRFVIDVDGKVTTCSGSLPLPPCDRRGLQCDADDVRIGESGCALPADSHAFSDILFTGYPRSVGIDAFLNDRLVARVSYQPTYKLSQPNGPRCDPLCCSASGDFTLDLASAGP